MYEYVFLLSTIWYRSLYQFSYIPQCVVCAGGAGKAMMCTCCCRYTRQSSCRSSDSVYRSCCTVYCESVKYMQTCATRQRQDVRSCTDMLSDDSRGDFDGDNPDCQAAEQSSAEDAEETKASPLRSKY